MDHSQHEHDEEDGGCSMSMIFHGGHCEYILFKSWMASTVLQFTFTCIVIFLVAVAYEALKYFREKWYMDSKALANLKNQNPSAVSNAVYLRTALVNKVHIAQTVLHFIQVSVSYALMLIVMTYNVWLCLSVALGASLGYFLFGWMRPIVDTTECCN